MTIAFDPARILRTLVAHDVRFVLIGGLAGNLRGTADLTNDLDICYARDAENLERLVGALRELVARLRVADPSVGDLPFQLDAQTLRLGDSFTFVTDAGDFDILATPSGTRGFEDLDILATAFDLGEGLVVRVVSLEDLMRMKQASGRAKDRIHLEHLAALQEEIERMRAAGVDPQQGLP